MDQPEIRRHADCARHGEGNTSCRIDDKSHNSLGLKIHDLSYASLLAVREHAFAPEHSLWKRSSFACSPAHARTN
jgi:hypothetical protein